MSRKHRRNRQPVIERANTYYGSQGIQGSPGYGYGGGGKGNTITLPASVFTTMLQNLAPQKNQAQDFAPGSPLRPYQGVVPLGGPRQWSYIVGSNLNPNDRTLGNQDIPSFAQLRTFAQLYEGVGLCERVILDMIPKLTPKVVLRKDLAEQGMKETDYQSEISRWQKFVEMPSPAQQLDIHSWLRMAYTEQTQIDALALFKHMTKGKQLFGLEIISGDTLKPLLDERGMVPQPPFPAYQQYPYGVPGDQYTVEQMMYYRESPRAFTPYGFSRIERIIMRVNQALRKEQKDLARFTEGNIPQGIMEVPDTSLWTPDQIDTYEQAWNSLLAGNQQQQVRIKFTQPGMKYTQFQDIINSQHVTEFDEFLINICVACYGLSMGDIGFTEDIHKSSGDSQQNMMYRRTLAPLIEVYAYLFTRILSEIFHDDRFVVTFDGFTEQEDLQTQASAYSQFATVGAISPASIARLMKFPDVPETGPFLLPKGGQPLFLEDMANPTFRKAQMDATMAGLQMAANPQQQQQGGDEGEQEDDGKIKGKPSPSASKSSTKEEPSQRMVSRVAEMLERVEETLRQIRAENVTLVQRRPEILQHHTGMMLAFMLDEATAKQLALPNGEPVNNLHCTLAYLGDMEEQPQDTLLRPHTSPFKIRAAIPAITSEAYPLAGHITGVGRFNPAETDEAALIALVDVPGLTEFRTALVKRVQEAGYFVATNHGYTPHITLQYFNANEDMPVESVPAFPLIFDTLCLAVGDDRYYFKLGDEQYPQQWEEQAHEQGTQATTEIRQGHTGGYQRGDSQVAAREATADIEQPLSQGIDTTSDPKAISAEYRRWRIRAVDDVKAERAQRGFTTVLIPVHIHTGISKALARCTTPEHVRRVFERADEAPPDSEMIGAQPMLEYNPILDIWEASDTEEQLQRFRDAGVARLRWSTHASQTGTCPLCEMNDGEVVRVGTRFKSGHFIPQCHVNCQCSIDGIKGDEGT